MPSHNVMNRDQRIETSRLYLRCLVPDDAGKEYACWLNDPVVNQYLETRMATVTDLRKYIQEKLESDSALFFGIFWKTPTTPSSLLWQDGKHIGNVKLEPVDREKKVATMGLLIGDKEYWRRGVGTEVTNAVVQFAFDTLGLREVNLGVIANNFPAIRVYEKCGFQEYRRDEKTIQHDGVLFDHVWMRKAKA